MILYNVTVKVNHEINADWRQWMKDVHIPDVMKTGLFVEYKMCRLLSVDESDGVTYAIQYFTKNLEDFQAYQEKYAGKLQREHIERYQDQAVAFRTLMEVI